MSSYRLSFVGLGITAFLAALLALPLMVMAQGGDRPVVRLKTAAWTRGELPTLPRLPAASPTAIALSTVPHRTTSAYWNQITFQSYRDGNWEIYWMNRFGANQTRFTHDPASDLRPRLSPDLREVVFASNRDGNWEIYKMKTDGTGLQRLTDNAADDADPAWSPDGRFITFARKKDGHWAIFRMNADGSGQWRLTYPGDDDDVSPSWSPDGNEIAWVRRGASGYGDVMVMQANGNNSNVLHSHLRYLQNVGWSPDGQHIAFDADVDGDDWNQVAIIRREDGWMQWQARSLGPFKDEWFGSWSPDGKYLLFTLIKYTVQDNQLYITETRIKKIDYDLRIMSGFMDSGLDMAPDWRQGSDNLAPTAFIEALPAVSPSPIRVQWSGTDAGPSGIASYDVQVRDNGGPWNDWQSAMADTAAQYPGHGGHRYAFRVRARDNAGNVSAWTADSAAQTTVEVLPPHSVFDPVPPAFIRDGAKISWRGEDEGGSGIESYNVQYKELGAGAWKPWQQQTPFTEANWSGAPGESFLFRVQAMDRAQNLGPWYETTTASTAYRWGITGSVYDNRHRPLAGAIISSTPAGQFGGNSDERGAYYLYVTSWRGAYQVQWQKPGYGPLPPTAYYAANDARVDVALPPPDNLVQQASFEISGTQPAWQTGGVFPAHWNSENRHTGAQSARVGLLPFQANYTHIENEGDDLGVHLQIDDQGTRHLSWHHKNGTWFYANIAANGHPSSVKQLGNSTVWNQILIVSHDGIVHAVWRDFLTAYQYPFYAVRHADGSWEQRKLDVKSSFKAAVDGQGAFHIVYTDANLYQQRRANGVWSALEQPPAWSGTLSKMIGADDGTLYLFVNQESHWSFTVREPDGVWHHWQRLPGSEGAAAMVIKLDGDHTLHILAHKVDSNTAGRLVYVRLAADGQMSTRTFAIREHWDGIAYNMFPGANGQVHLVAVQDTTPTITLFYAHQDPGGNWDIEESQTLPWPDLANSNPDPATFRFAADSQGRIYLVGGRDIVAAAVRDRDGIWRLWAPIRHMCKFSTSSESDLSAAIAIAANDTPYIAWPGGTPCDIYSTSALSKNGGDSYLSQRLHIPATMNEPTLSFFYRYPRPLASPNRLELTIDDGISRTTVFSTTESRPDWTQQWLDMSPWANKTITLTFAVPQMPGAFSTWAEIDDVSLGSASYPDLWVANRPLTPFPGQSLQLRLPYGNAGDGIGYDTQLTLTLPLSLTLAGADPPPSASPADHVWQWAVGDLRPARASAVLITATVPTSITAGSVLSGTTNIGSTTPELLPANNRATLWLFIAGKSLYLPLINHPGL